jgi:hypothetical protein
LGRADDLDCFDARWFHPKSASCFNPW